MDVLLQHAEALAKQSHDSLRSPINGRVAYVVSHGQSYASNGYAIRTQGIAKALNGHGFETLCFVRPGRPWELGAEKDNFNSLEVVDGVRYIHSRWPEGRTPQNEIAHLNASVERLCELFRIYRPEIVLAASNYVVGLPAWIAAKRLGIPFYNEVRGFWELSRAAREPAYEQSQAFRLEAERDAFVAKQALQVFTLNKPMMFELVKRGVDADKLHVVPNGVSKLPEIKTADTSLKQRLAIDPGDRVIGYVGSFSAYEGLDTLLASCDELVAKGEKIKLLLVGDDQPVTKDHGSDKSLSKKPWLIHVGRVPHAEVANFFALIDTVVIPRKKLPVCELVPPIKAVEALAYRKQLVISDLAPLREIAVRNRNTLTFEAGSVDALTKCLQNKPGTAFSMASAPDELMFAASVTPILDAFTPEESKEIMNASLEDSGSRGPGVLLEKVGPIELPVKAPLWYTVSVKPGQVVSIVAAVDFENIQSNEARKAVLLLKARDADGGELDQPLGRLAKSGHLQSHFKYLSASLVPNNQHQFAVPEGVDKVEIGFCAFNHQCGEKIFIRQLSVTCPDAQVKEAEKLELGSDPVWERFPVSELIPHSVKADIEFKNPEERCNKAAIIRVAYYDKNKMEIEPPYSGLPVSKTVGAFSYLKVEESRSVQLMPPKGAVEAKIGLQRWNAKDELWLKGGLGFDSDIEVDTGIGSRRDAGPKKPALPARNLVDINVAAILDEFTMECFQPEVNLTAITPENWEEELDKCQPDFLFVESCWFGNGNRWSGLMYGYTANGPNKMDELIKVIAYCRKNNIPSVFWAKEDPVHYKRFGPTAKLFDYVYTSDANMVPAYKEDYGIDAEPLSFFCQPRVHNPSNIIQRNGKAAFAGSYYSDKQERCENFHTIMLGLEQAGVGYDIYDRCLKRGVAHLQFPEHFKKHVVGYLEPHEMWKAYKGYRYTVNLNTVKHSPTMFARRVYESLASGTPVISNYSEGVITQFGGIVCASDNQQDIAEYTERLKDPSEYQRIRDLGVRETLGRHTLADRLEQVCDRLGIAVVPHLPVTNAIYTASTELEVERARALFEAQKYHRKRLVVNLENSNVLYPYLNQNTDEEVFRVLTEFAKPLDGIEVPMDLEKRYPDTLLEDEAIKTQYQSAVEVKDVAV